MYRNQREKGHIDSTCNPSISLVIYLRLFKTLILINTTQRTKWHVCGGSLINVLSALSRLPRDKTKWFSRLVLGNIVYGD